MTFIAAQVTFFSVSTLEIIFCAFLAGNYFVKVLIPFIGVRSRYETAITFLTISLGAVTK